MHTAEAAAKAAAEAAAAPAAGPAAPGTFWQFFQKCSGPFSSGPSTPFQLTPTQDYIKASSPERWPAGFDSGNGGPWRCSLHPTRMFLNCKA